ncbi:MAG: 2OG-Fe(II) oxygenase [Myxococcota bacterium]|nr:2OG-Fe(II) oxygenase [Myxococcota bacterium]
MGAGKSGRGPGRAGGLEARLRAIDWTRVAHEVDAQGHARIPGLLTAAECRGLVRLWEDESRFRTHVDLGRHRFGEGEYRYFARPLPPLVETLRVRLYPPLARIADGWRERLGDGQRHPATLARFLDLCRAAGQERPTPLLLRYGPGGYNCLHQDLYGEVAFPLQVALLLSEPGRDFEGGEFLLVEQRPRMQSRGEAIALARGEALVFPNRERPVEGSRGTYRTQMRHGVSRVRAGLRMTLGIIFHDSR